ncbi:hypothetical protein SBA2_470037 [Acidobacteriia bacterium SbA2]|nr:hypothetical protein SBA2_470037 [Acidobacteriia bacterium SbA2]
MDLSLSQTLIGTHRQFLTIPLPNRSTSVVSQKFVEYVSPSADGRKQVAQGASPGLDGPHPASGTPLPLGGRGDGGEGGSRDPSVDGLLAYARRLTG